MHDFQLIVPMSGIGQRFRDAGYLELKPFIRVQGKPIIEHILNMYPIDSEVLIILSEKDEELSKHIETLKELRVNLKVVTIQPHKQGPGRAIWEARSHVALDKPVVVNYADFSGTWNLEDFLKKLVNHDGNILTYTGFHPHMMRSQKFAYVRLSEENLVTDIQEKCPFTSNPMGENASSGVYGFKNGKILLEALKKQIEKNYSLNGEYYISLTYKSILEEFKPVAITKMSKFNQWGTPEDLKDWEYWDSVVKHSKKPLQQVCDKESGNLILLAAGMGSRVAEVAKTEKPFIKIGDAYLWQRAINDGSSYQEKILVTRNNLVAKFDSLYFSNIIKINNVTSGQAASALLGINEIDNLDSPLSIYSCDNVISCEIKTNFDNPSVRLNVLVARNYPPACLNPEHYSWLTVDEDNMVERVYLKKAPPNVNTAYLIIGNFKFRTGHDALALCREIISQDIRINEENYLDSVVELEIKKRNPISIFEVSNFAAIGTKTEYETYFYYAN